MKALVKSMPGLDFGLWKSEGQPVLGKGIPTLNGLAHQSTSFQDFLNRSDLREVPVSVAQKSSRPGSATLITGELYSLLCQHVGSVTGDPGFFVKTIDALFALREWTEPSISNPHYDHLIYFLLATLQGHNADIDELETILLKKLDEIPSILALQARQNWAQFLAAKSGPPDNGSQETNSPKSLSTEQEGRADRREEVDLSQSSSPDGSPLFPAQSPSSPGERHSPFWGSPRKKGKKSSANRGPRIYGMPSPASKTKVAFDVPKSPAKEATASTPCRLTGPLQSPPP